MCAGDKYVAAGDKRSKVGMGVAGDPAYDNDSRLYGAMGFVRKSDVSFARRKCTLKKEAAT